MLSALYKLGKYVVKKEKMGREDIFLDEVKLKRTEKLLVITIDDNFNYSDIMVESFDIKDKVKLKKLLYKGGPPAGVNFTPTSIVTSGPDATFKSRVLKWFKNHNNSEFLNRIERELENQKDQITSDLKEKYSNLSKDEKINVVLTIAIKKEEKIKYVGDYLIFHDILKNESIERYYHLKTIGESKGKGNCYLCNDERELFGYVPNAFGFSFSNADKKGNAPNFIQRDQWKQVPICEECGVFLEAGKKFVEKYLAFSMFGIKYYVIPNFLFKGELEAYDQFYEEVKFYEGKTYEKGLADEEKELYEFVKDMDDILEFKFLFYETKSGGKYTDILNYVESVLPSWVTKIHEAQKKVQQDILFQEINLKNLFGKNAIDNFIAFRNSKNKYVITKTNWYVAFLRDFFPFKTDNKYYLDIIGSIIGGKPVNKDFLISYFMKKIRRLFRQNPENDYSVKVFTMESLMLLMLLNELNINKGEDKVNIGTNNDLYNEKDFFEVYGEFIDTPDKKASFLMGILTKKLTSIQYRALGSTPFTSKLWGLSLDQKKLQKLYPMIINKLREYKQAYKDLEENISLNLLESSQKWNLSSDETSFYFTLGFTMSGIFKPTKKEEGDLNE
ncbi:MAG: TIGR02556 family CRISPR-associated protein [Methanobacteriaceae archaeon]